MKVRYLGSIKTKRKIRTGCQSCGKTSFSTSGLERVTRESIMLPSAKILNVRLGRTYDVSYNDGMYLLTLAYEHNGETKPQFEVV